MAQLAFFNPEEDKGLISAFLLSAVTHAVILLIAMIFGQLVKGQNDLQLTEVDFIEPMEMQPVEEKKPEPLLKKVIPIKKIETVSQPKPAPRPETPPEPPKPKFVGGTPLFSKQAITSQTTAAAPMISKATIGSSLGQGEPRFDAGPVSSMGTSGRQLNLRLAMALPRTRGGTVVDAEIAASLHGKRGDLSVNRRSDIQSIVSEVQTSKSSSISHGTGTASLGGFKDAFAVFGDIRNRKIIRMQMPRYPAWAEEQGIEAAVTLRVGVFADGTVDENSVYVEATSGYPALDELAMDAAKRFLFAALSKDEKQGLQYGSVRFSFRLRR
jgi:TonB family protein